MIGVGENRLYKLYMTVYLVSSLPKISYVHCIIYVIGFWPTLKMMYIPAENTTYKMGGLAYFPVP